MSFVYDIAEVRDLSQFCYDVKILYQLKGYKVQSLDDLCNCFLGPDQTEAYHRSCQKLRAHIQSYAECGIAVHDYEIDQVIPQSVLENVGREKQRVIAKLFHRFPDERVIQFYEQFFPKLQCLHRVGRNMGLKFNFVGSKTGRLSFKKNTFNPYVLPKEKRSCIEARPGYQLYQYDLKSSQPRIAIFSTLDEAFKRQFIDTDDIYAVFPGDREANKAQFLRWMFSTNFASTYTTDVLFDKMARPIKQLRADVFDVSTHGRVIYNRFGRPLFFSDDEKQYPHIVFQRFISSTEADALYEIVCNIENELQGTHSRILFPFYDAIICEIADEDLHLADRIRHVIENNYMDHIFYCKFPVEVKHGQDLGHLAA